MLNKMPLEIIHLTLGELEHSSDLKSLRLVSKSLSIQATRDLFSYCSVNFEDFGEPVDDKEEGDESSDETYSTIPQTRLENILELPHLKQAIRTIRFNTNNAPSLSMQGLQDTEYDINQLISYYHLTDGKRKFVGKCNRFPRLTMIEVVFAELCRYCVDENEKRIPDNYAYRTAFLKTLFASLNSSRYPTPNLTTISLKNLHNVNELSLTTSKDFSAVLGRIKNLRLRVVTKYDHEAGDRSWCFPEMHNFFAELPSTWLAPCSNNLEFLTIHCDQLWGYFPKCDWRSVHFPNLKRLELGNYSFSHDWQLDWILSHGEMLEVLTLDFCPIVSVVRQYGKLDEEKYVIKPTVDEGEMTTWNYQTKWSDYYLRMRNGLPKLRILNIGVGKWHKAMNLDGAKMSLAEKTGEMGVSWSDSTVDSQPEHLYTYFRRDFGLCPWFTEDDSPAAAGTQETGTTNTPELDTISQAEEDQFYYDVLSTTIASRLQE